MIAVYFAPGIFMFKSDNFMSRYYYSEAALSKQLPEFTHFSCTFHTNTFYYSFPKTIPLELDPTIIKYLNYLLLPIQWSIYLRSHWPNEKSFDLKMC